MLVPAGVRVVLREFMLMASDWLADSVKDDETG
jgi:hypothetical protein